MKIDATSLQKRKRQVRFAFSGIGIMLVAMLLATCSAPWAPPPAQMPPSTIQCTSTPKPVSLTMYYSSEKEAWINKVVQDFNKQQRKACDWPITINPNPMGSGQSMQQILAGAIKPDIWSPAGRIWLTMLNDAWYQKHGATIISTSARDTPSLLLSPVVIAMWLPEAKALGWPQKALGWADIARLSTDPRGWAAYGHPEWGKFKFTHTRPDLSNSGLDAVIAENYVGSKEKQQLTLNDVTSQATREFMAQVESAIIYYGDDSNTSSDYIAGKMFCNDLYHLNAAVMYENLVVEGNNGDVALNNGKKCPRLDGQVVAIYPKEGTFYSDHPFVIPQANWVTPDKKVAATVFRDFLLAPAQQKKALSYGFRPVNQNVAVGAPIEMKNHGVDPKPPVVILQIPPVDVVEQIQASWKEERRSVDVMLILDRSGSMHYNGKIDAAKQGLIQFVNQLGDLDEAGLTVFNQDSEVLASVMPLGHGPNSQRQTLLDLIPTITAPPGGTCLYETIDQQVAALAASPNNRHIKLVVVLTDGKEEDCPLNPPNCTSPGCITPNSLVNHIAPTGVSVFTIAYGSDAAKDILFTIAAGTGGEEVDGTPANIKNVYLQISQLF